MKITDVAKVVSGPNPHHVDARKIYESPHAMAVVITLKPGEALKKHITPVDVFFYVLEGSGVVEIGDEKQTVGKDMLVESPGKDPPPLEQRGHIGVSCSCSKGAKTHRRDKIALNQQEKIGGTSCLNQKKRKLN